MWILVIFSLLNQVDGYTVHSIEFADEKSCKLALKQINFSRNRLITYCVQK